MKLKKIIPHVTTELEALKFCQENGCTIHFKNETPTFPEYCRIEKGVFIRLVGLNFIETTNRIIDILNTPRSKIKNLPWVKDNDNFFVIHRKP